MTKKPKTAKELAAKAKELRQNKHKIKCHLKKLDREKDHLHREQQAEMAANRRAFDVRMGLYSLGAPGDKPAKASWRP